MRRLRLCRLLPVFVLTYGLRVRAQQSMPKIPRIGVLVISPVFWLRFKAFQEAFQNLGCVEGKNFLFEYRNAEGKLDRLPELAAELDIGRKFDRQRCFGNCFGIPALEAVHPIDHG